MDREAFQAIGSASELVRGAGTLAPVVAFGGIMLATLLDPSFSWTGDALSHLGIRSRSHLVFNGALVLGGVLASIYAVGLWRRVGRLVGGLFGVAAICLAGVGVFPAGHSLHLPAAVGFYTLVTGVFAIDGWRRRRTVTGRMSIGLATLHVLVWGSYLAGAWPVAGLALPEFAGALLVPCWIWWVGPTPTLRPRAHPIAI